MKSFWKAFHFPLSNQSQRWLLPFRNCALSFMKPLTELLCHPYQPLRAKGFGLIYLYICFQSSWQLTKMVHSCALRDMLWPTDLNWFWLDRRNTCTDEHWRCWRLPSLHHYVKISSKGEDLYTPGKVPAMCRETRKTAPAPVDFRCPWNSPPLF